MIEQPGDEIKTADENPINPLIEIPTTTPETPVTVPIDDPEIIVKDQEDYSNSLNALLKKYTAGSQDK